MYTCILMCYQYECIVSIITNSYMAILEGKIRTYFLKKYRDIYIFIHLCSFRSNKYMQNETSIKHFEIPVTMALKIAQLNAITESNE